MLTMTTRAADRLFAAAVAVYALLLGILLAILVAAALALPPAPTSACSASGHCHKAESAAAMRR